MPPVTYFLVDNSITPDPNDRRAITMGSQTFYFDAVIDRMVSRGSTVTKAEVLSVFEEFCLAIESLVKEGNVVITPLFRVAPAISGVFKNDDDSFDPARHQMKLRITPGARLREMESRITVEKVTPSRPEPVLIHLKDNVSDTQDEILTPGGGCTLTGSLLKFDEVVPEQGIFFVNVGNGSAKKVVGKLLRNKPSELIFNCPLDLTTGLYRLEVRTLLNGTKDIRTGALPYQLTVE